MNGYESEFDVMFRPYAFVYIWTGARQAGSRSFLTENDEEITISQRLLPSGFASKLTMIVDSIHHGTKLQFMNR